MHFLIVSLFFIVVQWVFWKQLFWISFLRGPTSFSLKGHSLVTNFFWWCQISLNVLGAFGRTLMPGQWRTGYLFQSLQPGLVCVSPYLKDLQKFSILIIDFTKTTVNSALEGTLSSSLLWLLQPEVHGPDELGEDKDTDSPMATTADVTSKAHSLPDRHITGAHSRIMLAVACLPLNFIEAGPEASFVATVQVCVFLGIRSFCPLFS